MPLPALIADLNYPQFSWQQALQAAEAEHDTRPTWAYPWPAGTRLLQELATLVTLTDTHVCDLGCGQGLLGLGALQLGAAKVSFCDASPHPLRYIQACLDANHFSQRGHCHQHRWAAPIPDAPYDCILGGDILYRPECFADLIASIASSLAKGGLALLSDPREVTAIEPELFEIISAHGLHAVSERRETYTLIKISRSFL